MATGEQPIVHLAHKLGLQDAHRRGAIEQLHQPQSCIGCLPLGRIDSNGRAPG